MHRFALLTAFMIAVLGSGCASIVSVQVTTSPPAGDATAPSATAPMADTGTSPDQAALDLADSTPDPSAIDVSLDTTGEPAATPAVPISPTVKPSPTPSVPTRIVAPAIGLDARVVEIGWAPAADGSGTEWQLPDDAAGFQYGSALPGQPGNTVIAGHHNIEGKVFARVHELVRGDQVDLYAGSQVYHYRVDDSFILPERGMPEQQRLENASWIAPTGDERLTLVTCWPPNDNSYRVIVIALPD